MTRYRVVERRRIFRVENYLSCGYSDKHWRLVREYKNKNRAIEFAKRMIEIERLNNEPWKKIWDSKDD